jgi:hypothetical protein
MRRHQLHAIRMCFDKYNEKGGSVIPLQTGGYLYFPRAVILAIYADHPAAVKCTMVGKACIQCFTSEGVMHLPPATGELNLRTDDNVKRYRDTLSLLRDSRQRGAKGRAQKRARRLGIPLHCSNPFSREAGTTWVFGPHRKKDSVYQAIPQVVLHGCDEGTTAKLARGVTLLAIAAVGRRDGASVTEVSPPPTCVCVRNKCIGTKLYFQLQLRFVT